MSEVTVVVAVAENGVIGHHGGLPWRLSSDLKRFRADTLGKPVLMGRKTFDSIGRALPGRRNIVITRNRDFAAPDVETAPSLADAIALADGPDRPEICVIGGGGLFAEALPLADRLRVTHVLAQVEGDTFFPEIDPAIWKPVFSQDVPAGPKDIYPTRHVVYERR